MSRAYRIRVRESLRRIERASDRVSTQLELLAVLPAEEIAALLAAELERSGYERVDGVFIRRKDPVQITVDPSNGHVVVQAAEERAFERVLTRETGSASEGLPQHAFDRVGPVGVSQEPLNMEAPSEREKLQLPATEHLEQALLDFRPQLDRIVNRVTVEALKRKATAMGRIKSIAEDGDGGSLTIVLEI